KEALTPAGEPVLRPGPLGAFDDNGVTSSCLVRDNATRYLYYSGWSLGVTVPFYFYDGCAVSEAGGAFERISAAPILDRNDCDPYRLGYAESPDGLTWTRKDDEIQLSGPSADFDAEMQAYPVVEELRGEPHLLYNGDRYGATGIGWAVAEAD